MTSSPSAPTPPSSSPSTPSPRAAVLALPAYVAGRRADSELTAALASNESHYPPLPSVLEVVRHSAGTINRYPDNTALPLRTLIAEKLGVEVDETAVGPGSTGVLQQIITSVCDSGDEVVFAWRSFEAYPILVRLAGAVPVAVPLLADEGHDLDAMAEAITDRTRLVILCTPNNPTGVSLGSAEVERFLERVPSHVLVVIDEAYTEYATRGVDADAADSLDAIATFRRHPNVCVLRTFSKAYGLAGLRVGYAVAAPVVADGLRRSGMPFAVSALAQQAAIASLEAQDEISARVAAVVAERTRVIAALRAQGWDTTDSQANFVWLRMPDDERLALVEHLDSNDILVRGYVGDGVRISLADAASNDRVLGVLNGVRQAYVDSAPHGASRHGSARMPAEA
ncbi:histidinol-phosphate transaminase [Herbiconiux solani]|uniref:histidinol-phosphate transaminase n=1 Tax=Herbiconiux solani TaxID=661329 RepID=UPI0008262DD1|nr:histidinol-phosphate transaminase [Herbiconiux solani]